MKATEEVADALLEMPTKPLLLSYSPRMGLRQRPPTLDDDVLRSTHMIERVGTVQHPQAADSARVIGGIDSFRLSPRSCLQGAIGNHELGLFLWRGDVEVALGYSDFLGGFVELRPFY